MSFTISEIIKKTKYLIEENPEIGGYISIIGEIGTIKIYGKHAYLSLKEENYILKGVYFNISSENAGKFQEGTLIEAFGYLSIYEQRGEFQFYIKSAREISKTGLLQKQFDELKKKLLDEGVIPRQDEQRRVLPEFPETIGLVTSKNGAALQDMIKTFKTRYPELLLKLFHTGVQGNVENQIISAIQKAEDSDIDLLIIARGGGSLEDLWCFNNERVVRKIRACTKPVITGIGHETDHTLSEYAADYIASTPTAAAMIATPDIFDYLKHKSILLKQAESSLEKRYNTIQNRLYSLNKSILKKDPYFEIHLAKKNTQDLLSKAGILMASRLNQVKAKLLSMKMINNTNVMESRIERVASKLIVLKERIKFANPDKYLELGYSRIEKKGRILTSVVQLKAGEEIKILLKDGEFDAEVKNIKIYESPEEPGGCKKEN